jgi:hypothetical protein
MGEQLDKERMRDASADEVSENVAAKNAVPKKGGFSLDLSKAKKDQQEEDNNQDSQREFYEEQPKKEPKNIPGIKIGAHS